MNAKQRIALEKLSRPTWRLEWRDYRVFGDTITYYLESATSSERLADSIAKALIAAGYAALVDAEHTGEWRRTYVITEAGRQALAAEGEGQQV